MSKDLIKEAGQLRTALERGMLNLSQMKSFLARVEAQGSPSAKRKKQMEERARVEQTIK